MGSGLVRAAVSMSKGKYEAKLRDRSWRIGALGALETSYEGTRVDAKVLRQVEEQLREWTWVRQ